MTRAIRGFDFSLRRSDVVRDAATTKSPRVIMLLAILLLVSAFSVIYLKDLSRRLFIRYQHAQLIQQRNEIEWSKLILEEDAQSAQARVQTIATQQLGMVVPAAKQIIMIREQ